MYVSKICKPKCINTGLLMGPCGLGLFSDLNDMESLADFGVLFLLFEQGLELTVYPILRKSTTELTSNELA